MGGNVYLLEYDDSQRFDYTNASTLKMNPFYVIYFK